MSRRHRQHEPPVARERRRQLRQSSTEPEQLVWAMVRSRKLGGFKFRRQHSIGPFIADFACVEQKLVLELDGGYHDYTVEQDLKRQAFLEQQGFRVLRISNEEVWTNLEGVVAGIRKALGLPADPDSELRGDQ